MTHIVIYFFMKRLREITVEELSKLLPLDVIDSLIDHNIKEKYYLPRISSLDEVLLDYLSNPLIINHSRSASPLNPHYRRPEDIYKKMVEEFIQEFPVIARPLENVKEYVESTLKTMSYELYPEDTANYIDAIDKFGYVFIIDYDEHPIDIHLIYKLNDIYYGFFLHEINEYKTHNKVIDFMERRGISTNEYIWAWKY